MDPLSDILSLLHVENAVAGRVEAGGQWAIQSSKHKHIVFGALLSGPCWLIADHLDHPVQMSPGDCFLVTDGSPVRISSDLTTEAIDGGAIDMDDVPSIIRLGTGAETSLIGTRFVFDEVYGKALLSLLPPAIYLRSGSDSAESLTAILRRLGGEIETPRLGSDLVVNHLAHLAMVQAIRASLACKAPPCTGWLGGLADHKIGTALRLIHREVPRRWTLADLATAAGMSRSSFAHRFKELVGMSPLDYLLHWRIHLAARKLRDSNKPISFVASELGYESESAFSNAFKRIMGNSPKAFRMMQKAARPEGSRESLSRDGATSELDASIKAPSVERSHGTNGVSAERHGDIPEPSLGSADGHRTCAAPTNC